MLLVIGLVGVALFWDAPLEQLANPLLTPNPAKAPWYFLGLQELLHYFPPLVAGIIIPTLVSSRWSSFPISMSTSRAQPLWSGDGKRRCGFCSHGDRGVDVALAWTQAWTVLVPTEVIAGLMLYAYSVTSGVAPRAGYLPTRPALLVGDDVVHFVCRCADRGRNVLPRPRLVLGLAVEVPCRLSRWDRVSRRLRLAFTSRRRCYLS